VARIAMAMLRLIFVKDGQELLPGIQAISALREADSEPNFPKTVRLCEIYRKLST
jgi:hypothetical protein